MATLNGTLVLLEQQLKAMDVELALMRSSRNSYGGSRAALERKLEAAEKKEGSVAPFGMNVATRRRLEGAAKRENRAIREDLGDFLAAGIPRELAELRTRTSIQRQLAPRRGGNGGGAIRKWDVGVLFTPQNIPSGPVDMELTPPAVSVSPSQTGSAAIGELNLRAQSSGMGGAWGLLAAPTLSPTTGSLRFAFTPPFNAAVYATAQVDVSGTIYAVSHDHWYTTSDADCTMRVGCNLFQKYLDPGPALVIADEHHSDSGVAYWLVNTFSPTASTTVEADMPAIVEVWASLDVYGRSDHALVDADFLSGADNFIRVPRITVTLVPI